MLFSIEGDHGSMLSGYAVPDGFSGSPTIVVRNAGRDVLVRLADEPRLAIAAAGRHETGAVGFAIDEQAIPGLRQMEELEIYDAETELLLYRRRRPHHVGKQILRLESHLFPLWRLDATLNTRFQHSANQIESHGLETATQLFLLYGVQSSYLSGRIFFKSFRLFIDDKFDVVFVMHHPLEEFAERLIVLAQIKKSGSGVLGMRGNLSLGPAMEMAQSLPFHDERALARRLREMPNEIVQIFANPVARQLTTAAPDEKPSGRAVSMALDTLASFALVGLRRAPRLFNSALAEFVGIEAHELPSITNFPGVTALAQMLKRTRVVDALLEYDLEIYAHIANAYAKTEPAKAPG